jgi:formiminotetrahydrofolate cyclodeaminase
MRRAEGSQEGVKHMTLQKMPLEDLLSQVGRAEPLIGGSSASLLAAKFGVAMVKMAFAVSSKHGADNDLAIQRLDLLSARLNDATEQDCAAALALIETFKNDADQALRRCTIIDATRAPLLAAHLLVELLQTIVAAEPVIKQAVASDLFGGVELINGAFAAVMMAIENNLSQEEVRDLNVRTHQKRSDLRSRHDIAAASLRSSLQARGIPFP